MTQPDPSARLLSPEDRADIQGFVTSGYGHLPRALYLFVHFTGREAARDWFREMTPDITTARSWRSRTDPDAPKDKPTRVTNVAFTFEGLMALGLSERSAATFAPEFREGIDSPDRARILGDVGESAADHWEVGGARQRPVHVLLIHGAGSDRSVRWQSRQWREQLEATGAGLVVAEEFGSIPPHGREHFGFRDGIAQPTIQGLNGKGIGTGEFILGYENEYGYHPVSPRAPAAEDNSHLLPASPNPSQAGYRDLGRNGTYLVYRKLEQNVAGFWRFMEEESQRRQGATDTRFMIWLAAKMVGRWPGGAPLTLSPEEDDPGLGHANEFLYAEKDGEGLRCPFGAHIRRTNPRDQLGSAQPEQSLNMTARHLLLRRGRLYGDPLFPPEMLQRPETWSLDELRGLMEDDAKPRGVHFIGLNASIKSQFEFVQQAWINNPQFNGLTDNPDPLMGGPSGDGVMHVPGRDFDLRTPGMPRWVTVRGGGYFFMPGIKTLRWLVRS